MVFQVEFFCVVTPCNVVVVHRRFRDSCRLHLYHNTTRLHNTEELEFIYFITKASYFLDDYIRFILCSQSSILILAFSSQMYQLVSFSAVHEYLSTWRVYRPTPPNPAKPQPGGSRNLHSGCTFLRAVAFTIVDELALSVKFKMNHTNISIKITLNHFM
jgi:hypothetical protein